MDAGRLAIWLGIIWTVSGFALLYVTPLLLNYEGQQPQEKISILYSDHFNSVTTNFNFVTVTKSQYVSIYYAVTNDLKPGFIVLTIPYDGVLTESPSNWQTKQFSSGTTVLYKNMTCGQSLCSNEQGQLKFVFSRHIDSFRMPNTYVQIPFSNNPTNPEVMDFINAITPKGTTFTYDWRKITSEVQITIDKQFDEWDTQPTASIGSRPNPDGGNNIMLKWNLNYDDPLFTAKFSRDYDRSSAELRQTWIGISIGGGVGMIAAGIALIENERGLSLLRRFIKIQRYMQDANTSYLLKKFDKARISYDLASKLDEKNIDPILLAGNSFFEIKRYRDALEYYKKILNIDPNHIGALNNAATCYDKLEDFENAIEMFERTLEVDQNHIDALNNMGALALDVGFPDCALPFFDETLKINKYDVTALANKGKSLKRIAKDLTRQGMAIESENMINDAKKYYEESLQIDPTSALTLTALGELYFELGNYEESYACFNRSMKIEPLDAGSLYNMGIALFKLHKFEEALKFFDEYLILNPNNITALNDKGVTLSIICRDLDAIGVFNKILSIEPTNVDALHNIGLARKNLQLSLKGYRKLGII